MPHTPTREHDEIFCPSCGEAIKKEAVICVKCGVQVKPAEAHPHQPVQVVLPANPKDKTVAVILAVFLGLWTWIYTYQKDNWKFWLNLVLCILTFGFFGFVTWIWAIVDTAIKPDSYYKNFPNV